MEPVVETPETAQTPEAAPDYGLLALIPVGSSRQQFFMYANLAQAESALSEATAIGQFRYRHVDGSMTVIQTGPGTQYLVTLKSIYDAALAQARAEAAARQRAQQQQVQASLPSHLRGAAPKS